MGRLTPERRRRVEECRAKSAANHHGCTINFYIIVRRSPRPLPKLGRPKTPTVKDPILSVVQFVYSHIVHIASVVEARIVRVLSTRVGNPSRAMRPRQTRRNKQRAAYVVVAVACCHSIQASGQMKQIGTARRMFESREAKALVPSEHLAVLEDSESTSVAESHVSDVKLNVNSNFESTIAGQLNKALAKEFNENETVKGVASVGAGRSFDSTVRSGSGTLETVARVTRVHDLELHQNGQPSSEQDDRNVPEADVLSGSKEKQEKETLISQLRDVSRGFDRVMRTGKDETDDVERLIDSSDNEFVISNPKRGTMELQQDLRLIRDLVFLFCSAAAGSTLFCLLRQPVITGYLLAGSLIGPGGLGLIVELVQVETLAQFGVIFLLFSLGLEFSASKLRHIRGVTVLGGTIEIMITMLLCGVISDVAGAGTKEGVFVGALLSMSSTAVAGKCVMETGALNTIHGQIAMGTLILQDCYVGLLFALVPVLAVESNLGTLTFTLLSICFRMFVFLGCCLVLSRTIILKLFRFASRQAAELFQMLAIAFCLSVALTSDQLGLSLEFGAFIAGIMISATPYADKTVESLQQVQNVFVALFMVSIGLIMNPIFLWIHADVLLGSLLIVIALKTFLIGTVVRAFGYSTGVGATVGISLAQIGELSFVLLSRASNVGLIERKLYLLLLGTTALSLVVTPTLVRSTAHGLQLASRLKLLRSDNIDLTLSHS